jgi:aspartyl/asparaginyl beta-hydroxylase
MKTAFFSILAPGKHIPVHRGPYQRAIRAHLGLIIPDPKERCRIRVGNQFAHWNEGEVMVFDDSYVHEVWNDTDGIRVVLFSRHRPAATVPGKPDQSGDPRADRLVTIHPRCRGELQEMGKGLRQAGFSYGAEA